MAMCTDYRSKAESASPTANACDFIVCGRGIFPAGDSFWEMGQSKKWRVIYEVGFSSRHWGSLWLHLSLAVMVNTLENRTH